MKFKVAEDVDAPVDLTWARFLDFSRFEREVSGRGAKIERVGGWEEPGVGVAWKGEVKIRGRTRKLESRIDALDRPDLILINSVIGGVDATYELKLQPLRSDMTRVHADLELKANTLSARLALQALKLARSRVLQRLQGYLAIQGNLAEDDYRRSRIA